MKGNKVEACTSQDGNMEHLMIVAPDVERARAQPFGKSANKQANTKQQRQGFGKIPLSPNLMTCFLPTQRANALEYR